MSNIVKFYNYYKRIFVVVTVIVVMGKFVDLPP